MSQPLDMHVVLVPGLVSPPSLVRPLGVFLAKRVSMTTVWKHESTRENLSRNVSALAGYLTSIAAERKPVGVVSAGSGDWVTRQVLAGLTCELPSHFVSISPTWVPTVSARCVGGVWGSRNAAIAMLRDPDVLAEHLRPPPRVQHLILQSSFDRQSLENAGPTPPEILPRFEWQSRVSGMRHSLVLQPNVWRQTERFLRSQWVDAEGEPTVRKDFRLGPTRTPTLHPAPMAKVG